MQRCLWLGVVALVGLVGCGGGGTPGECADGTWDHDGNGATACVAWTTCAAGEYVTAAGSATSDRACSACQAGTYSAAPNAEACLDAGRCPAGTALVTPVSATAPVRCDTCVAGEHCPGDAAPRAACAAGTWDHDASPVTACVAHGDCAPGTRVSTPGDATQDRACAPCGTGEFSTTTNAAACTPWTACAPGTRVSAAGDATHDRSCAPCGTGEFSDAANAATCSAWSDCPAGQYVATAGTATNDRACAACASGTYSSGPNQAMCVDAGSCAAGTVNTAPATATTPVSCDACVAGEHCPGGLAPRAACAAGTWDHDGSPATACVAQATCAAGTFVSDAGSATTNRACSTCATGAYSDAPNASACTPWVECAAGQYVTAAGTPTSNRACTACATGSYSTTANASTCVAWTACAAGQYVSTPGSPTVDRACSACAAGTFSTAANAPSCTAWTPCASGFVEATPGTASSDRTCAPEWIRAFGTTSEEAASDVAFGSDRSVVAAGSTYGDLAGTGNAGFFDAWVRKYSPTGTVLWTRQFGSAASDRASGVAVGSDGSVVVAGTTAGDLDGNGSRGLEDGYLRKFDASGTPLWTRQFGTNDVDWVRAVRVGSDGRIVVVGATSGALGGSANLGANDVYVRVFDATGTHLWTRQFGTDANDDVTAVALGSDGRIVVAGHTQGDLGTGSAGSLDAYVRVYDATGTPVWTRQFGTAVQDFGNGVALTPTGGVVIAGMTYGALEGAGYGSADAYVRVYDASGTHQWTRQFGTTGVNIGSDVTVGSSGRIVVAGSTDSALDGASHAGSWDAFLRAFDASGTHLWTRQLGTSSVDDAYAVSEGSDGSFAVAGQTYGDLAGATNAGMADAFVARLSAP